MSTRAALVVGVGRTSGIGAGILDRLAADGWDLALVHFSPHDEQYGGGEDAAERLAVAARERGVRVVRRDADLADAATASTIVEWATGELGSLGALVLTHAESVDSDLFTTSLESWDRHFAVNARASWLLIRDFAAQVPEGEPGRIVALTSDHVAHNLPYGASKGALDRIVLGAAGELGPRGITANIVNPGPIDTGWMDGDTRKALTARQPTGRLGRPSDTAALVSFLVSDDGAWVTGQLITSDGGFSL